MGAQHGGLVPAFYEGSARRNPPKSSRAANLLGAQLGGFLAASKARSPKYRTKQTEKTVRVASQEEINKERPTERSRNEYKQSLQ